MTTIVQVVDQMQAHGLPVLPHGHPVLDGKIHRFGTKKKSWYALREIELKSGRTIVGGAFGIWQGDNNNAVTVAIDWQGISPEERAAAEEKQRAHEEAEKEKKAQLATWAANRAKQQWDAAGGVNPLHPYLVRKLISGEGARCSADGLLLVPMYRDRQLVGLQKIMADGTKLYNKGMDKNGAAAVLGKIDADTKLIIVAEGYATAASIRLALKNQTPVVVAFDAGNLTHVAQMLRRNYPDVELLFAADDDWMLEHRLNRLLTEEFKILDPAVVVDGIEVDLTADDGTPVQVTATWSTDQNGIKHIAADIRSGRRIRTIKFENAGIARSTAAAVAVGHSSVSWPRFADRGDNKWTDYNDLHVASGLPVVMEQLENATIYAETGPTYPPVGVPAATVTYIDEARKKKNPPAPDKSTAEGSEAGGAGAASGKGGRTKKAKVERGQAFYDTVNFLLENFVLLYGTNTAWDKVNRLQIKITDLRYAYGSDAVKWWLGNVDRHMINADRLVFDPTGSCDPDTTVNMFRGFSVTPKKGACDKIIGLLRHLCDGNEELTQWIICWIAYPLQHPGAKMETSVIMHGDEGSGKNLFWEKVVRRMYGEYGGVIGNAQIEAQFNEWASQKLFFVADEVVTRNELKQLKGKLKGMISGDEIRVNPKNLPERSEANHLNFVFLSNELKPLELDKTDRRYLVAWTPKKRDLAYYKEVADEIFDGGMEAFYYYLLHEVDLGDFNEHTKPIDTRAKANLISLGLSGPERFYREWSKGALPLPFMCCSAMQLYAAFQRWSHLNGERFPPTQTEFGGKVERMAEGTVVRKVIKYDAGGIVKQRTAYVVGEKPADKTLTDWFGAASELFEGYLKKYRHVYDQSEQDNPSPP